MGMSWTWESTMMAIMDPQVSVALCMASAVASGGAAGQKPGMV